VFFFVVFGGGGGFVGVFGGGGGLGFLGGPLHRGGTHPVSNQWGCWKLLAKRGKGGKIVPEDLRSTKVRKHRHLQAGRTSQMTSTGTRNREESGKCELGAHPWKTCKHQPALGNSFFGRQNRTAKARSREVETKKKKVVTQFRKRD